MEDDEKLLTQLAMSEDDGKILAQLAIGEGQYEGFSYIIITYFLEKVEKNIKKRDDTKSFILRLYYNFIAGILLTIGNSKRVDTYAKICMVFYKFFKRISTLKNKIIKKENVK